jgi:hypothetical protein
VSLFGAIFAANLASGLASRMPAGKGLPAMTNAAAIAALPQDTRDIYLDVFTGALHTVFLSGAVIGAFAFALSWFLKEIPLQAKARSETIGESFAMPVDATSLEELELIVDRLRRHENRWDTIHGIAQRAGVNLAPDEMWLLIRICRQGGARSLRELAAQFAAEPQDLDLIAKRLVSQGLLARAPNEMLLPAGPGVEVYKRLVEGYRKRLSLHVERWAPEKHAEVRKMLNGLARDLVAELPKAKTEHAHRR